MAGTGQLPAGSNTAAAAVPAIQVDHLVYEYATKRALHDINFSIEHGSVVALVGPNGAGKTTLLRCIAALEMPFLGRVRVCGLDTEESPRECHRALAYLADTFGLYDELTGERCLQHAAAMRGMSDDAARPAIARAVESLDLKSLLTVRAGEMSRGQRQRLAIAQTILHRPRVLLLDEPASGLDPESRADLAKLIGNLAADGMTIVVSSHILAELQDYSTHMLTIDHGAVLGFEPLRGRQAVQEVRRIRIATVGADERLTGWLVARESVTSTEAGEQHVEFEFSGSLEDQFGLLRAAVDHGFSIYEFHEVRMSLQDRYLSQLKAKKEGSK